jgi:hypothetical protein
MNFDYHVSTSFRQLGIPWAPVFTGVMTFCETISFVFEQRPGCCGHGRHLFHHHPQPLLFQLLDLPLEEHLLQPEV